MKLIKNENNLNDKTVRKISTKKDNNNNNYLLFLLK